MSDPSFALAPFSMDETLDHILFSRLTKNSAPSGSIHWKSGPGYDAFGVSISR
jgi:hypothetical protein